MLELHDAGNWRSAGLVLLSFQPSRRSHACMPFCVLPSRFTAVSATHYRIVACGPTPARRAVASLAPPQRHQSLARRGGQSSSEQMRSVDCPGASELLGQAGTNKSFTSFGAAAPSPLDGTGGGCTHGGGAGGCTHGAVVRELAALVAPVVAPLREARPRDEEPRCCPTSASPSSA